MNKITQTFLFAQFLLPQFSQALDCSSTEATRLNPFAKGNVACTGTTNNSKTKAVLSETLKQNIELLQEVRNVWPDFKYVIFNKIDLKGTDEEKKQAILKFIELSASYGPDSLNYAIAWTKKQGFTHPQENLLTQLASSSVPHRSIDGKATLTETEMQKLISKVPASMKDSFIKGYLDRLTGRDILETDLKLTMKYKDHFSKSYLLNLVNEQISIAEKKDYTEKYVTELKSVVELIGSDNTLNLDQICELAETVNNLTFSSELTIQIPDKIKNTFIKLISPQLLKAKKMKQDCDPDAYQVQINQVLNRVQEIGFEPIEMATQQSVLLSNQQTQAVSNYNSCKLNEIQDDFLMSFTNLTNSAKKMFMRTTSSGCTLSVESQYLIKTKKISAEIKIYNNLNQKIYVNHQEFVSAPEIIKTIQSANYQVNPYQMTIYSK